MTRLSEATAQKLASYLERRIVLPEVAALPTVAITENGYETADPADFRDQLFDRLLTFKEFYSAQSYGGRIETLLFKALGIEKTPSKEGRGDGHHPVLGTLECKVSIADKGGWSIQQIRSWHNLDHYVLLLCDISAAPKLHLLVVPAAALKEVVAKMGKASHGTKEENEGAAEVEMGLRFGTHKNNALVTECLADLLRHEVLVERPVQ